MDNEGTESKSVRLPTFGGAQKDFQIWWTRFLAYGSVYKFAAALKESDDVDLPASDADVLDLTKDEGKRQDAARKRNNVAMANFTMAFTSEALMGLVFKAQSAEWPGGKASRVVKALMTKYMPKDRISRVELRQMLASVAMKDNDNPATLFEQISAIENKYNTATSKIEEEELIAVVMTAAPKAYVSVITTEQRIQGTRLKLEDLESAMSQQYRQTVGASNGGERGGKEFTLGAFGGICYRCHKTGHKAKDCPDKNKKGGSNEKQKGNKNLKCNTCGKGGHKAADCWSDESNANRRPKWFKNNRAGETGNLAADGGTQVEFLLNAPTTIEFPSDQEMLLDPNVWIADTGATVHMTSSKQGVIRERKADSDDTVTMANGMADGAESVIDIRGTVCNKEGKPDKEVVLQDVSYMPKGHFNLFSVTRLQKDGWILGGDSKAIWLTKGDAKLEFDIVIPTKKGMLFAMYIDRHSEVAASGVQTTLKTKEQGLKSGNDKTCHDGWTLQLTVQKAHEFLGHPDEAKTRLAAKVLNWNLTRGGLKPCEACAAGKAKQKNVPKESVHVPATMPAERVFLDISTVKKPNDGTVINSKKNWRIIVDERTQMKFSEFFETKNGMIEPTCVQINQWNQNGLIVKYLHCDNAGENRKLEERINGVDWKLNVEFEYTARDTPQQNHLAELAFATIANRGRAMMHRAHLPMELRYKLFPKAFGAATVLDWLMPIELDGILKTRYEHFKGAKPKFVNHLRIWGEAGTVKLKTKRTPKIADRGVACMYLGPALKHGPDCCEMWDPVTGRIHVTRDVIWLKRMFYEKTMEKPTEIKHKQDIVYMPGPPIDDDDEGFQVEENEPNEDSSNVDTDDDEDVAATGGENDMAKGTAATTTTTSGRQVRPPTRLIEEMGSVGAYEIKLTDAEKSYYSTMRELGELAFVGAGLGGGFGNTNELKVMKYNEAMATNDRDKWKEAVEAEYENLQRYNVFKPVSKDKLPKNAKILTSKIGRAHV